MTRAKNIVVVGLGILALGLSSASAHAQQQYGQPRRSEYEIQMQKVRVSIGDQKFKIHYHVFTQFQAMNKDWQSCIDRAPDQAALDECKSTVIAIASRANANAPDRNYARFWAAYLNYIDQGGGPIL